MIVSYEVKNLQIMQAGGPIMWIIAFLSVLAAALVIERFFFFRRSTTNPEQIELALCEALFEEDAEKATRIVKAGDSSLHRLFQAGVAHWRVDHEAMKMLLEQEVRREIFRWEKGLNILATIARVAPLLGLLGTVLGMVEIFRNLTGVNEAPMVALAGGIWKALFTTVAGLSVAVPIILFHTFLSSRVDDQEETLNRGADFLLREHMIRSSDRDPFLEMEEKVISS